MKEKVVSLRFTTLIILVSLFLLHSLRNSLAHAQHQAKAEDHIEAAIMKQNHWFAHNKVLNDANTHVAKRKKVAIIGGRKMIKGHHHMYEGDEEEDDDKVMKNRRIPVLSGAIKVKGVHYRVNDDNQHHSASDHKLNEAFSTTDYHGDKGRNALKNSPKRSSHDSYNKKKALHDPGSSNPTYSAAKSKKLSNQDDESEARKDETKRLFEATKEIMKLMHKDYGGRWRPRRKPPIHNRIPQN